MSSLCHGLRSQGLRKTSINYIAKGSEIRGAIALASEWKGSGAKPEQATINVYLIGSGGKIGAVITDLLNPNGLVFSPDEK